MLALARAQGWPVSGYHEPEHPVQRRVLQEVSRWTGLAADDVPTAVDGCGVVTFALSMRGLAHAFARLAAAARSGEAAPTEVVQAMVESPEFVAGTDRLCTQLMRDADGRIFAKTGAEGIYCAGIPGAELGIALKVEDGSSRASGPALVAALRALGLLSEDQMAGLVRYAEPDVTNTRGDRVGRIRAVIELEAHAG
jgi:L-asparaginase II